MSVEICKISVHCSVACQLIRLIEILYDVNFIPDFAKAEWYCFYSSCLFGKVV